MMVDTEHAGLARRHLPRKRTWATDLPLLWPGMLLPQGGQARLPFPLNRPNTRYLFMARNGIYALIRQLDLVDQDVLFPAYFHGVELEALVAAGARPRFYPVHADMHVDPEEVVQLVRPQTRAIYLIHYLGLPGPIGPLLEFCQQRGIRLIEDCALAYLSSFNGQPLGSFGDAGIFCFYKTIPTPDGGAVVLRDGSEVMVPGGRPPSAAGTAVRTAAMLLRTIDVRGGAAGNLLTSLIRTAGRSASRAGRGGDVEPATSDFEPHHVDLVMSDTARTVAANQDTGLIIARRRRNYQILLHALGDLSPPLFGELAPGVCPLFYPFRTEAKLRLLPVLKALGVDAVDLWRVHRSALPTGMFPEVDSLRRSILELPCHQDLSAKDMARLARAVRWAVSR